MSQSSSGIRASSSAGPSPTSGYQSGTREAMVCTCTSPSDTPSATARSRRHGEEDSSTSRCSATFPSDRSPWAKQGGRPGNWPSTSARISMPTASSACTATSAFRDSDQRWSRSLPEAPRRPWQKHSNGWVHGRTSSGGRGKQRSGTDHQQPGPRGTSQAIGSGRPAPLATGRTGNRAGSQSKDMGNGHRQSTRTSSMRRGHVDHRRSRHPVRQWTSTGPLTPAKLAGCVRDRSDSCPGRPG